MDNKHMLYDIPPRGLMAVPSKVGILEAFPPLDTLEAMLGPSVEPAQRKLIALVGRKGTGKHTYLRDYYSKLGPLYIPYATGFIEQAGMHPVEQRQYMDSIKSEVKFVPPLLPNPYMFVTYSPYIVDEMTAPHEVIVFHRSSTSGRYYRAPLTSHPDYSWAQETLTLGELWDSVGEDWLEEHGQDVTYPDEG